MVTIWTLYILCRSNRSRMQMLMWYIHLDNTTDILCSKNNLTRVIVHFKRKMQLGKSLKKIFVVLDLVNNCDCWLWWSNKRCYFHAHVQTTSSGSHETIELPNTIIISMTLIMNYQLIQNLFVNFQFLTFYFGRLNNWYSTRFPS